MELLRYQFDGEITAVDKTNESTDSLFLLDENDSKSQTVITPGKEGVLYVVTGTKEFFQWDGAEYKRLATPKSVTFILSTLQDNKILMRNVSVHRNRAKPTDYLDSPNSLYTVPNGQILLLLRLEM